MTPKEVHEEAKALRREIEHRALKMARDCMVSIRKEEQVHAAVLMEIANAARGDES